MKSRSRHLNGYEESIRILLVDDDVDMRAIISALILQIWKDVELELAAGGREALQKLNDSPYHVVLTDLQMPEMDGYETARAIRALPPPLCHVKIVCMTGGSVSEDRLRAHGIDGHLLKPFTLDDLRLKISEVTAIPLRTRED